MNIILKIGFLLLVSGSAFASQEGKLAVPGGNIWYSVLGQQKGIPLIVIHGGPGGSSCSLHGIQPLASQRPIVFYDQLGAGKSESPMNTSLWHIDRFVSELDKLLTTLKFKRVHLLAHSWGAAIAAQYLELHTSQTKVVSIIFAGPYLSSADWVTDTLELKKSLLSTSGKTLNLQDAINNENSEAYQQATSLFYEKHLFHKPHKDIEKCSENDWNNAVYELMWGHSEFNVTGNLKDFDAAKDLNRIKIPTLFLIGEFDMVTAARMETYKIRMQNASIQILKNAAHMSMIDDPETFNARVSAFLESAEHKQPARKRLP